MKEYIKLDRSDRFVIRAGINRRESSSDIARTIGKHRSVITREINKYGGRFWYDPEKAHQRAIESNKKGYCKIEANPELKMYIIEKLKQRWSPQVIAGVMKREKRTIRVSAEAIYQWIYSEEMKDEKLYQHLPSRKKKRGLAVRKTIQKDSAKKLITQRPKEANERVRIGDWEGDLVFQKGNQSANILTLIDRKTRYVVIAKNDSKHADVVGKTIQTLEKKLPMKTLTLDNGTEFSNHQSFATDTYFCHPGSPWEKGSIEHLNKMVRIVVDYRKPIEEITQEKLDAVAYHLNNMPRKILGFLSPAQAFEESRVKLAWPDMEAISM
jgi:transposase, IS30 family